MKQLILFICIFTFSFTKAYCQTGWLRLNYPQSNILGKSVLSFENGDINFLPHAYSLDSAKIDVIQSADDITEYNQEFKSFITKYLSSKSYNVIEVKAKKLVIKSLNSDVVRNMTNETKYVYSGLSADSVDITVQFKKEKDVDYSKLIKDLSTLITGEKAAETVTKIAPLFDSISYHRFDTLSYKMTLANPNVFYKIKIIKYHKTTFHDWEKYYKFFNIVKNKNPNPTFNLICDPLETTNSTLPIYPERYGNDDPKNIKFRLTAKKIDNDLKLFIQYTTATWGNELKEIEVVAKIIDGKKYWIMNRSLVYTFDLGRKIKQVYIQIRAEENGIDTIKITSWNPLTKEKLTYMQYPEIKLEYVTR